MTISPKSEDSYITKTRLAYTLTRCFNTPFWAIYTLLPFIMWKDLNATSWQIACVVGLKPVVSLFSVYWSSRIKKMRSRLLSNIVWAGILGHLPFLFVPWVSNPWYFVFASAVYMLFYRGVNPAWLEVLKINIPSDSRKIVFAYGSAVYHLGGALFAIGIGYLLDDTTEAWRMLFPLAALLTFVSVIFQVKMPIKETGLNDSTEQASFCFKRPWKDAWQLVCERPDFARYQIGFMLGGTGLMFWQPALPQFFIEVLQLNYTELTIAMTLCKSIGYAISLPVWTRAMCANDLFGFTSVTCLLATLFPFGLMAAEWNIACLYGAYLVYGVMQAGSEMSWNLSGPMFSKNEDSSTYSGVNVLGVGIRGCIAPPFGSAICTLASSTAVLLIGSCFCLAGCLQLLLSRKKSPEFEPDPNQDSC